MSDIQDLRQIWKTMWNIEDKEEKMINIKYNSYYVTLIILHKYLIKIRMEHIKTKKCYENVIERTDFNNMNEVETIEDILKIGFLSATIKIIEENHNYITLNVDKRWTIKIYFQPDDENFIRYGESALLRLPGCSQPINCEKSLTLIPQLAPITPKCPSCNTFIPEEIFFDPNMYNPDTEQIYCPTSQHMFNLSMEKYSYYLFQLPHYMRNIYKFTGTDLKLLSKLKYIHSYSPNKIRSITIHSDSITDYSVLGELTSLQSITIRSPILQNISWIKSLKQLKTLQLEGCVQLPNVNDLLAELPELKTVNINRTMPKNTTVMLDYTL